MTGIPDELFLLQLAEAIYLSRRKPRAFSFPLIQLHWKGHQRNGIASALAYAQLQHLRSERGHSLDRCVSQESVWTAISPEHCRHGIRPTDDSADRTRV